MAYFQRGVAVSESARFAAKYIPSVRNICLQEVFRAQDDTFEPDKVVEQIKGYIFAKHLKARKACLVLENPTLSFRPGTDSPLANNTNAGAPVWPPGYVPIAVHTVDDDTDFVSVCQNTKVRGIQDRKR